MSSAGSQESLAAARLASVRATPAACAVRSSGSASSSSCVLSLNGSLNLK